MHNLLLRFQAIETLEKILLTLQEHLSLILDWIVRRNQQINLYSTFWQLEYILSWLSRVSTDDSLSNSLSMTLRRESLANEWFNIPFFFCQGFLSRKLTTHRTAGEGGRRHHFYSTLPLPPAHEHPDIYSQLCMWDDEQQNVLAVSNLTVDSL